MASRGVERRVLRTWTGCESQPGDELIESAPKDSDLPKNRNPKNRRQCFPMALDAVERQQMAGKVDVEKRMRSSFTNARPANSVLRAVCSTLLRLWFSW